MGEQRVKKEDKDEESGKLGSSELDRNWPQEGGSAWLRCEGMYFKWSN